MEIFKNLDNPLTKEFEQLLNNQLSKIQIEEGKIINGKINKITDKFVFLFVEGLKSEPVLDINELKNMGLSEKIKLGETIPVLIEKIEDRKKKYNRDIATIFNKFENIKKELERDVKRVRRQNNNLSVHTPKKIKTEKGGKKKTKRKSTAKKSPNKSKSKK